MSCKPTTFKARFPIHKAVVVCVPGLCDLVKSPKPHTVYPRIVILNEAHIYFKHT